MKVDNLLSREFLQHYPREAARVLEQVSPGHVAALFAGFPLQTGAPVLASMLPEHAAACLEALPPATAGKMIMEMPVASAGRFYRLLSESTRNALIDHLPPKARSDIRRYLAYPSGTAGALLDPRIDILPENVTVVEALHRIEQCHDPVGCDIYVVDDAHRLVGVVELGRLMAAEHHSRLRMVMRRKTQAVSAHADVDTLQTHPGWSSRRRLPVVERDATLVGALDYSRLEEATAATASATQDPLQSLLSLTSLYWLSVAQLLDSMLNLAGRRKGDGS